ncbi:Chromate resistance protein ChrB [Streptomyces sp. 900116325]
MWKWPARVTAHGSLWTCSAATCHQRGGAPLPVFLVAHVSSINLSANHQGVHDKAELEEKKQSLERLRRWHRDLTARDVFRRTGARHGGRRLRRPRALRQRDGRHGRRPRPGRGPLSPRGSGRPRRRHPRHLGRRPGLPPRGPHGRAGSRLPAGRDQRHCPPRPRRPAPARPGGPAGVHQQVHRRPLPARTGTARQRRPPPRPHPL